jgi:hypothetical protein
VRSKALIYAAVLACGTARVGNSRAGLFPRLNLAPGSVVTLIATPGTISFQATNPNLGTVSGSSPGSVNWMILGGSHLQNWTLSVQAGGTAFTGCPTIPISAVRVSCGSASVSGAAGTGACAGSFPLSTTPQQIAGGAEADSTGSYSVSMNYTLAESWRYVASSACSFTLTYIVDAQ